ncbi:MAG: chemotaxis protein CheA, partial [Planctomycetes bacterium]|nr:chemotaxis protein CheA [Planctomycetota bacterium]
ALSAAGAAEAPEADAPQVDALEAAMAEVTRPSLAKNKQGAALTPRPAPAAAASGAEAATAAAMTIYPGAREPIRVNADRLDRMIDAIGELGIAESMVSRLVREPARDPQALFRYTSILSKITRELQQVSMALRMVPVRSLFHKMARLVHNLSHLSGKQLELVTEGEDTELDRTLVNCVGEALVHMVRNSVDHGIERDAAARMEAGKPIVGRITLRAYNRGGSICVAISDDGRGLDRDAIYRKAVEKGLLPPGAVLTDAEVFRQIFVPGFSTQDEVTAISGRGVGMDVVRRNIERMHGHVDVESVPGKGTTFVLRVPLTLASIDGMVVGVGDERYIIPTSSIRRTVQLSQGSVVTVAGRGELLLDEGMELPLCRLREVLFSGARPPRTYEGIAMVVETEGRRMAFLVDNILEQQQIVIKSLGNVVRVAGIAGGTIMADGRVGLILDVAGLMEMVNGNGSAGI